MNDVEIWTRALREEESLAMKLHCEKEGNKEMENIEKAIRAKHAKELQNKKALESALPAFDKFKKALIQRRKDLYLQ